MPKFTKLNPTDVQVGRGRGAAEMRLPYIEALKEGDAGRIELERGDQPQTVKRLVQAAAKQSGIRIRSSWETKEQKSLVWKKVGA
jgi:hypothetical protein